jgi:lysyl-tRNA synthetase class 1
VFRKVPDGMPQPETLEKYLRYPITEVPDPFGRDENYARHHEVDVESVLPRVGIFPEFLYQSKRYRSGMYAEGMRKALQNRAHLREIFDSFRDPQHKIQGDWWPVSVFCEKCRHDETKIIGWDGENPASSSFDGNIEGKGWLLTYECEHCGHTATVDLRTTQDVKLGWRVDWPMRWEHEHVDFEPAGKDHHSQGGSFDTSKIVCKDVYGITAPVTFQYDFIGIKGSPGKMSSSKGKVVNLEALLNVYQPEVARFLFAGTRPNTEFTISFDADAIKLYEDYDKMERIALGLQAAKNEDVKASETRIWELSQINDDEIAQKRQAASDDKWVQVPFRHLCNLVQIHDGDIDTVIKNLGPLPAVCEKSLRTRAECCKYWVTEDCSPDEFKFKLNDAGFVNKTLSDTEKAAVRALRDNVVAHIENYADDKSCAQAIYDAAEACGVEGKALFRAAYQALINKDQGPRLANFLRIIAKDRLMDILKAY